MTVSPRLRASGILLAALLTVSGTAWANHTSREYIDGGRGNDASGFRVLPTMLPRFGEYEAYLLPYDVDWYGASTSASTSTPVCFTSNITSEVPVGEVNLVVKTQSGEYGFARDVSANVRTPLAIAVSGHTGLLYGVDGSASDAHGDYVFDLHKNPLSSFTLDGGSGGDAGSDFGSAVPVSGGCFAGRLNPVGLGVVGDSRDVYKISGNAGDVAMLSYAPTVGMGSVDVLQVNADGTQTVLATLTPSASRAAVTLPATGDYYLATSTMGTTSFDYLIGAIVGPPGSGCEPTC